MRVVRIVFVLLVAASALEIADSRGLVADDSAVAAVAETVRSLRAGELDVAPLADLQKVIEDVGDLGEPFRVAAEALE